MTRRSGVRRLFRLPSSEARAGREVQEEIEFHLEMRVSELRAQGLGERAARAQALHEFGDPEAAEAELTELARRRVRQARRADLRDWAWSDLRHAARVLLREPLFTIGIVLTLALGIGANAAMFGMTDRVLLQDPPHVASAEQVKRLYYALQTDWAGLVMVGGYPWVDYVELRKTLRARELGDVAAYQFAQLSSGRGQEATRVSTLAATASYFPLLGVRPLLGRFYTDAEDVPGRAAHVAVLGYGYWQERYGGAAAAVGQTVDLGGTSYTIIGVAPQGFRGVDLARVDLFIPAAAYAARFRDAWETERHTNWLQLLVRASGPQDAIVAAATHYRRAAVEEYGDDAGEEAVLAPLNLARGPSEMRGSPEHSARISLLLLGVALIVLLVACANVANLMLARTLARSRELGVRVALGVTQVRLLSLIGAEALLLAILGGGVGLALAYALGGTLRRLVLPGVDWSGPAVDGRVAFFSVLLVLLCTAVVALLPALHARQADVSATLRSGVREGGGRRAGVRRALVIAQASLCVLLLTGAGLFVRSLRNARAVDFGMETERVLVMQWASSQDAFDVDGEQLRQLYDEARRRVSALPGVESAAIAATVPFQSNMQLGGLTLASGDTVGPLPGGGPYFTAVDPEYFATMGTRLLQGRGFEAGDRKGAPSVAIVDAAMARQVWPNRAAVGECIMFDGECTRVVGVVESAMRQGVGAEPAAQFFVPRAQSEESMHALFVRARGEPAALVEPVRRTVQALDASLPYATVQPLGELIDPMLRPWRLGATLFLSFGVLALAVAAVGLYSVIAYGVTQRRHELGVRMALGARAQQLHRLVLTEAARMLAAGIVLGVVLALVLAGTVRDLLFRVSPRDPLVFGSVALLLLLVGVLATLAPARRAARLDPLAVLREE